jgi:hypothetical protein
VRGNRGLLIMVLLALLSACSTVSSSQGSSSQGSSSQGSSSHTTTSGGHRPSTPSKSTGANCPFSHDSVIPKIAPLIQMQAPGGSSKAITGSHPVTCSTIVRVANGGSADTKFGSTAVCELSQDAPAVGKVAKMTTRAPLNALLRLGEGQIRCTLTASGQRIILCHMGTLLASGDVTQGSVTCDEDPVFSISAYSGSLQWLPPRGEAVQVPPGMAVTYDFDTNTESTGPAQFTAEDVREFTAQAKAMDVRPKPAVSPPAVQQSPVISRQKVNLELSTSDGTWTGTGPLAFGYQWQNACDTDGNNCRDIDGATDSSYQPTGADCPYVRVLVTATNVVGSATATSVLFDLQCIG